MDWVLLVLVVEILLLVFGWVLFQQAKTELNARALEQPALAEMRALASAMTALLDDWKRDAARISADLDDKIAKARLLLGVERGPVLEAGGEAVVLRADNRAEAVRAMALEGTGAAEIARQIGCSEGEVEFILGIAGDAASPPGQDARPPGR